MDCGARAVRLSGRLAAHGACTMTRDRPGAPRACAPDRYSGGRCLDGLCRPESTSAVSWVGDRRPSLGGELSVGPVCLGMVDDPDVVIAAYETRGCNFFFVSADLHWPRYDALRTGIKRLCRSGASDVVVAVVSYVGDGRLATAALVDVLDNLGEAVAPACQVVIAGGVYDYDAARRAAWIHK